MPVQTAKLFNNGRSQAVRLPREFRFHGDEVFIRREGEDVILSLSFIPSQPKRTINDGTARPNSLDELEKFRENCLAVGHTASKNGVRMPIPGTVHRIARYDL